MTEYFTNLMLFLMTTIIYFSVNAKCDRTIGFGAAADDAPLSISCIPSGFSRDFFELQTRTKTTFNNVHVSRKEGTVRISALGET